MVKDNIFILRICATILVVLFHSLGYYTNAWPMGGPRIFAYEMFDKFINQINMPLFVCISGYLYAYFVKQGKYLNKRETIINKFKRLIVPYIFLSIVQLLIFYKTTHISMLCTGCLHLWFLLMLFNLFVIFILTQNVWIRLNFGVWCFLCVCSIILSGVPNVTHFLCVNAIVGYMPFFIIGIIINMFDKKNINKRICMFVFVVCIISLLFFTVKPILFSPFCVTILRKTFSLGIVSSIIILTEKIVIDKSKKYYVLLQSWNMNSMGIYIIHHIIIWGLVQISYLKVLFDNNYIIMPIVIFIISFIISWLLSMVINKSKKLSIIIGT